MHIRLCRKTAMVGKNFSVNTCVDIIVRILAWKLGFFDIIMYMGLTVHGTGGREKAPAAVCRKVIQAKLSGQHEIEIWGDGLQTRSFMFIDDCLKGTQNLLHSDIIEPLNLGSTEMVTINQLVDIVEEIAGIQLKRNYNLDAPKGVRGRSSDNTLIQDLMGWAPSISLRDGMGKTYAWIYDQIQKGY